MGTLLKIPIVQFICSTASYAVFLILLTLTTLLPGKDVIGSVSRFTNFILNYMKEKRFRKAGRVWCGGAQETREPRVSIG